MIHNPARIKHLSILSGPCWKRGAFGRLGIYPQGQNKAGVHSRRPPASLLFGTISSDSIRRRSNTVIIPSNRSLKSGRSSVLRTGCHWELKRCYRGRCVSAGWRASGLVPVIADQISSSYADNSWALCVLYPPITPPPPLFLQNASDSNLWRTPRESCIHL